MTISHSPNGPPRLIWLVSVGEPLPIDGDDARLHRVGLLVQQLRARSHRVVWWASSFNHHLRRQRVSSDAVYALDAGFELRLLHGPGYRSSIGLRRILNHRVIGWKFRSASAGLARPDVILSCFPTIELAAEATRYAQRARVPVVIDVRDRWPEGVFELFPGWARPVVAAGLRPAFRDIRRTMRRASAIFGITAPFVDWGLRLAGRPRGPFDRDFPLASDADPPAGDALESARAFWHAKGIVRDDGVFTVCFFGQMSRHLPLDDVLEAARILEPRGGFRFLLAGDGVHLEKYRGLAAGLSNVVLPGWITRPQIWAAMELSRVGIGPYRRTPDFQASIPNKAIEYLSGGLPVLTTLDGLLGDLIEETSTGRVFEPGDPVELARLLESLAASPADVERMSIAAKRLHAERFQAAVVYGSMADALEELAARGSG